MILEGEILHIQTKNAEQRDLAERPYTVSIRTTPLGQSHCMIGDCIIGEIDFKDTLAYL